MDSESSSSECNCSCCLSKLDSDSDSDSLSDSDEENTELKCKSSYDNDSLSNKKKDEIMNKVETYLGKSLLESEEFKIIRRMIKIIAKTNLDRGLNIILNFLENKFDKNKLVSLYNNLCFEFDGSPIDISYYYKYYISIHIICNNNDNIIDEMIFHLNKTFSTLKIRLSKEYGITGNFKMLDNTVPNDSETFEKYKTNSYTSLKIILDTNHNNFMIKKI